MRGEGSFPVLKKGSHLLIIPYPAFGHLLPHLDLTNQLALRGLTITILITPKNLPYLNPLLSLHPSSIQTLVLPFPSKPSIPPGVENLQELPVMDFFAEIATALSELHDPIVHWFKNIEAQQSFGPPVAIIPDIYLISWALHLEAHLGVTLIAFSPVNANSLLSLWREDFDPEEYLFFFNVYRDARKCWGIIFNSFVDFDGEELEEVKAVYVGHDRVWAVGPLLPINYGQNSTFERGGPSSMSLASIMAWLDSCQSHNDPVVYVGFGSQITLNKRQMQALARALEDSGVRFIWVVKEPMKGMGNHDDEEDQSMLPAGFEVRVDAGTLGKGLVIRGWAPQAAILGHQAVVSYLTHCGWNSLLEALLGGVLLLAWPMQADHHYNVGVLVDQLGAGIQVCDGLDAIPDSGKIAQSLKQSLSADCPERIEAMRLGQKALDAIKEGGTSFLALDALVAEISNLI